MLADPGQFRVVFDAMLARDPVVRMRAADAVEKLTRRRPGLLRGLEDRLLTEVAAVGQQEVRWHVAQLLPRLALTRTGTPAMRSRGRKLPACLQRANLSRRPAGGPPS